MNAETKIQTTPHSIELEQQILGNLMANNDLFERVAGITTPEHFYEPTHGAIFRTIAARLDRDHVANAVTVASDLSQNESLQELGGASYLARLVGASMSSAALKDYARDLEALWQRRTLLQALEGAVNTVREETDAETAKGAVEAVLTALPERDGRESSVSATAAFTETLAGISRAYQGEGISISTGLEDLDKRLGGFWAENLIVLAGRPSMGKSAVAMELVVNAAKAGNFVAMVSLEMSNSELMERVVGAETRIDYEKLRRGDLTENEMRKVVESSAAIKDLPLFIVPPHVRDIGAIHAALKNIKRRQGRLDMVVVDYLQLIVSKGQSPNERVSEITRQLKALAKVFQVPVVALSQLSRAPELRDNKRPMLSDLRDSGSIEQDADVVLFCYRDEYYLQREQPPKKADERADYEAALSASRNKMEIITAKQRMGPIGIDRVGCHLPTNRFWNLSETQEMF